MKNRDNILDSLAKLQEGIDKQQENLDLIRASIAHRSQEELEQPIEGISWTPKMVVSLSKQRKAAEILGKEVFTFDYHKVKGAQISVEMDTSYSRYLLEYLVKQLDPLGKGSLTIWERKELEGLLP